MNSPCRAGRDLSYFDEDAVCRLPEAVVVQALEHSRSSKSQTRNVRRSELSIARRNGERWRPLPDWRHRLRRPSQFRIAIDDEEWLGNRAAMRFRIETARVTVPCPRRPTRCPHDRVNSACLLKRQSMIAAGEADLCASRADEPGHCRGGWWAVVAEYGSAVKLLLELMASKFWLSLLLPGQSMLGLWCHKPWNCELPWRCELQPRKSATPKTEAPD